MGALYGTCNPCFPLWRAFLLLCSWVSKPIPFYLSKYFELMCFIHSYDDLFNHVSYVPCFAHCSYLEVYYFESYHWKARYLWTPANYQLFFDQELSLPLPIMIHFMYLYCVSFTHCKLSYIIVSCLLLWSMYLMNVMLLVRILLSTLHSINLRPCLLSSVSLGDKRSLSLGGVDTSILHHYSMS